MTMYLVPLTPVPNQKCSVRLDGVLYELAIKAARTLMAATITRDGALVTCNAPCLPLRPLIAYRYLEKDLGNFVFVTKGGAYPHYARFGGDDALYFLTPTELAEARHA
jgi:hypothetical protein